MIKINGNIIVNNHIFASSIWQKTIGLMFSRKLKDKGLIFKFNKDVKHGFHMFFVFYPIDIIFLNKEMTIIEIKNNFRPFSYYKPKKEYRYAIELPKGKAREIKLNNYILIQ